MNEKQGTWARPAIALATLGVLALLVRWLASGTLEPKQALDQLRSIQGEPWAVPVLLVTYLACTTLFFPAALFHVIAAAAWGFPVGLALSVAACNLAATLQFLAARRLGRDRVAAWMARSRFSALEFGKRPGLREAIAIRVLPLPTMAVNVGAGLSAIKPWEFSLGTLIGTFPVIAIYTYVAATVVEGIAGVRERVAVPMLVSALALLALTYGPRLWMRRRARG